MSVGIFRVGDTVDLQGVLFYLTLLVILLGLLDVGLHRMEQKAKRRKKYMEILGKVYRGKRTQHYWDRLYNLTNNLELMILGMISFAVVIASEVGFDKSSDSFIEFESAHMLVFFTALMLTVQAIGIYFTLQYLNRKHEWLEDMNYDSFLKYMSRSLENASETNFLHRWWVHKLAKIYMTIKIFRGCFMTRHNLPLRFPFCKYLREAEENQVSLLIEIDPLIWTVMIILWWILWGVQTYSATILNVEGSMAYILGYYFFASCLLTAAHVALISKLSTESDKMLKATGCNRVRCEDLLTSIGRLAWKEENHHSFKKENDSTLKQLRRQTAEFSRSSADSEKHWAEKINFVRLRAVFKLSPKAKTPASRRRRVSWRRTSHTTEVPPRPTLKRSVTFQKNSGFQTETYQRLLKLLLLCNAFFQAMYFIGFLHLTIKKCSTHGCLIGFLFPLPLALNTLVLQPYLIQKMLIMSSIWNENPRLIGKVLDEMVDALLVKQELGRRLYMRLEGNGQSLDELMDIIRDFDQNGDGQIDTDEFQEILSSINLHLSAYRFKSLLSCLKNGTGHVNYMTLYHMVHDAAPANEKEGEETAPEEQKEEAETETTFDADIQPDVLVIKDTHVIEVTK